MMVNIASCGTFNWELNEEQCLCVGVCMCMCLCVCAAWDQGESLEAGKRSVTHGE